MSHPLGETRAERVAAWEAIAAFEPPGSTLGKLAALALKAARAETDDDMRRLAVEALGLHGDKAKDTKAARLREALDEFARIVDAVDCSARPGGDWEDLRTWKPEESDPEALATYRATMAEGAPAWLYRRVHGAAVAHGEQKTHLQQLRRLAAHDPGARHALAWSLGYQSVLDDPKTSAPRTRHSAGRVR